MSFSNPIWLWGLLGLTVPITIHLLSRKESKVIQLGSLRHLQDSITSQSVNIRLNEVLLLLLRSLLLLVTVLLLAGLNFTKDDSSSKKWLLIEPGVDLGRFAKLIDSLKEQGFISKQFAAGFPNENESITDSSVHYWSLTQKLGLMHLGQSVVISKDRLAGFRGKRIPIPQNVTWLSSESDSTSFDVAFDNSNADSVVVRRGSSSAYLTSFNSEARQDKRVSNKLKAIQSVSIVVASDPKYSYDSNVMLAALHAIQKNSAVSITIKTVASSEYDKADSAQWLIWLSDDVVPIGNENIIQTDTVGETENEPLLLRGECDAKPCWKLVRRLDMQTALNDKLVIALSSILFQEAILFPEDNGAVYDRRIQPEQMVWSKNGTPIIKSSDNVTTAELAVPLVIVLMLLLISERWLSLKRNQ